MPKPLVLAILDGFGYRADSEHNAILKAKTPHWDALWQNFPHTLLQGCGVDVGLPKGQMGNSEVGHMHIGAGRVIHQDLTRINQAISDHVLPQNPVLTQTFNTLTSSQKALHIIGLLSPGGVHSHQDHILAMIECAKASGITQLYVHAILDGRDTPPKSAKASLQHLEECLQQASVGQIASIIGRYYAMDRDNNWERTQSAYALYTDNKLENRSNNAVDALQKAYALGQTDEFIKPTRINNTPAISDGDAMIVMNFRADRMRQLVRMFIDANSQPVPRKRIQLSHCVTLTQYADDIASEVIFPPHNIHQTLGEVISHHQLKQLRIAETEKYAHVTFFFNGGREAEFEGETRQMIASPKVATYDLQPEMSAQQLTDALVAAITGQQFDLIVCNYANADMVGHTGNMPATIKAIECIDGCLNQLHQALALVDGQLLVTADHGNAEQMFDDHSQQPHTAHTQSPVPFLYVGRQSTITTALGSLIDVAPTVLDCLGLPIPTEMTGQSLLNFTESD